MFVRLFFYWVYPRGYSHNNENTVHPWLMKVQFWIRREPLTSPWYRNESYTLRIKSQKGQRYSNLNSSTKSASSTSAHTTRNFRYRKVLKNTEHKTEINKIRRLCTIENTLFCVFVFMYAHVTNNKATSLEGAYGRSLLKYHKSMPLCTFNISLCAARGKGGHYQVWHEKYLHRLVLLF